jgi:hypothetical protein
MIEASATSAGLIPPLEKGRVVAEGDRVEIVPVVMTPTRRASRVDLPLKGGGMEFA